MSALQQGALDVAERQFKSLLTAQPNHLGALNLLGVVQLRLGKAEDAERSLRKAIRSGSNFDPATLCNYAMALRQLGRSSDALERLDQALAIQPDNFENWNSRGVVLNDRHPRSAPHRRRAVLPGRSASGGVAGPADPAVNAHHGDLG